MAAAFNLDAHPGRPGVQRVLEQFLYNGCRALDDLAGRDLVRDLV